jgi:hypothetical protein
MIHPESSEIRNFPPQKLAKALEFLPQSFRKEVLGKSVLNQPIYGYFWGRGDTKVLMWSQMHGNESTSTRALTKLMNGLDAGFGGEIFDKISLLIIPQLNPDGAKAYTRFNANEVDLNRDAILLSQPESKLLKKVFEDYSPDFCFNLHDQRTIFAAGKQGLPATLSFLAPAGDPQKSITPQRLIAMQLIAGIDARLQACIPGQIGRFDDTFNPNCVGDTFTALGVPTLLFEAGHFNQDYHRDFSSEMMLKAYEVALNSIANKDYLDFTLEEYLQIPENEKDCVDLIIEGVKINANEGILEDQELAIQYQEVLRDERVFFEPTFHAYGSKLEVLAHRRIPSEHQPFSKPVIFQAGAALKIT